MAAARARATPVVVVAGAAGAAGGEAADANARTTRRRRSKVKGRKKNLQMSRVAPNPTTLRRRVKRLPQSKPTGAATNLPTTPAEV